MNVSTQNNRLMAIDLARGLAVFFMIAVHTLEVFASQEVKNSVFGQIIEFLGGPPAAPVFKIGRASCRERVYVLV